MRITTICAGVLILSIGLGGCKEDEDLAQVRALSQLVVSAEPSYTAIEDDLYQSCLRQTNWSDIGNFALRSASQVKPAKSPQIDAAKTDAQEHEALALAKERNVGTTPVVDPFTTSSVCDPYIKATAMWKARSSLLVGYFEALGAAAGGGDADYGYANLWMNVSRTGVLPAVPQAQLAGATTDIITALFDARRRRLTGEEATKANAAVALLVDRLSGVADDYLSQLDNEQASVNSFFRRNFVAQSVGLQTLETIRYREDWKNAIDAINIKRAAEAAYVSSLKTLAAGNESITTAVAAKNIGAVYSATTATVTALQPALARLQQTLR